MYLLQRVEEIPLQYQDSRKEIAEFVLAQGVRLEDYTMAAVAERCFCSKPTLVRFAKTLGFAGWREFQREFLKEERERASHYADVDPNEPFGATDDVSAVIAQLADLKVESILDTADLLDKEALQVATSRLLAARNIVVFAMSPNSLCAQLFRRKMRTIGLTVLVPALDECGTFARTLDARDCALLVSYSGNNPERQPMCYVEALKQRNVPLVTITSDGENYLSQEVDCVLSLSSRERLYSKIAGFATEASLEFVLDVLFALCFQADYGRNLERKVENSRELERRRYASLSALREEHENAIAPRE